MAKISKVARTRSPVTEFGGTNPEDAPGTGATAAKLTEDKPKSAPNLALNICPTKSRGTLCLLAGFAIVLQLGILVYTGFVSWLGLGKKCHIVSYGYFITAAGMALLVVCQLSRSRVVKQVTVEHTLASKPKQPDLKDGLGSQTLGLQQGGYINNEGYPSLSIFRRMARTSMMSSWQRGLFEEDSTFFILFYSCWWWLFRLNRGRPSSFAKTKKFLESLVFTGTLAGAFGFLIQFAGLQSMHRPASTAQPVAILVMSFLRSLVPPAAGDIAPTQYIHVPGGHEVDWLAPRLGGGQNPRWTTPGKPRLNNNLRWAPDGILDSKSWEWSVVAEAERGKLASLGKSQIESGFNDVFNIHKKLGKLSNWTGPTTKFAMSVKRSVEAVMNAIFTQKEYLELKTLSWPVHGLRGSSKLGKINLSAKRGEDKRWVACAAEIEAALSRLLSRMKEGGEHTVPGSVPLGDGTGVGWLQEKQAVVHQHAVRLLGDNKEYIRQDLHWYLGDRIKIVSEVKLEETPTSTIEGPTSTTTNIIEIERGNIVSFANSSPEIAPNCQQFTRFRTRIIQLHSGCSKTALNSANESSKTEWYGHLAIIADGSLELLLAQDLFSGFMWAVADKMRRLGVESTLRQANQIKPRNSKWFDSLRLENTALSSMARDLERAGLERLEGAYASIILPLSVKGKLPIPYCLFTRARERVSYFVTRRHWEGARDIYTKLFRACSAFGLTSPLAINATATVYEGLRASCALAYLWERWEPNPLGIGGLPKMELGLQRELGTADERVVSNLGIMQQVQRHHVATPSKDTSSADCHQNIQGSESGKQPCGASDLIGFSLDDKDSLRLTPLHCAVIAGEWVEIECYLAGGARVNAKDVLGWTPLHYAATQGSRKISEVLLSTIELAGANPNIQDLAGRTALHQAADNGHEEIMQLLLGNGACIGERDNHGSTALHLAAQNGHSDTLRGLLANSADREGRDQFGWRPLHCAANSGRLEVVHHLLQMDADKDTRDKREQTPLHHAAFNGYRDVVVLLLENGADREAKNARGDRPIHHAAQAGHFEVVRVLLENGAEADAQSYYRERPLHYAALGGYLDVVQLLLEKGASKEATSIGSQTPLHLAAVKGRLNVVRLLLEKGVKTEVEDTLKLTPLHCAASFGHLEVVRLLLDKTTANPNAEDKFGQRPLHCAAESGDLGVVRLLLKSGADIEAKNHDGESAYHTAISSGHPAVAQLLLKSGADRDAKVKG